ncbi:MAG: ABC transporter permease [Bacteroidota bacterium]|nr:ABC transporter permease [Bacteroidota bacterium]
MIKNYFKTAWRNLRRNKVSSIINISGLSVGLATGIIILLVTADEFSYDRFNRNLNDIYLLMKTQSMNGDIKTSRVTPGPLAPSLRNEIPEIKYAVRATEGDQELIRSGDKNIYVNGIYAEPDFFNMMTFSSKEGNPVSALQEPGSAVITVSTAKKLFGNEDAMGKVFMLNNTNALKVASVIADVPQNSSNQFDVVLPFHLFDINNNWLNKWDDNRIQTWIQVKPNVNIASLNKKLKDFFLQKQDEKNIELFAYPLASLRLYGNFKNGKPNGGLIDVIRLIGIIGLFVLLIACINFMNLATAQSERRAREVGVRKVLGASKRWIIFQFLSEALLLSFLALLVAILLATLALPYFLQLMGKNFTPDFYNWHIWLLLIFLALTTGLVAGSYPAFWLSHFKPVKVLKNIVAKEKGGGLLRKGLVTFQFIISIFLIIAIIVIFKQLDFLQKRPIGYDQENLIDIDARGDLKDKFSLVKNDLLKIPGVKNVSAGTDNLIRFGGAFNGLEWPGKTAGQDFFITSTSVQYDWAKTAGFTIAEGRDFSPEYGADSSACLVNEAAVKRMGLKEPVVGIKLGNNNVIGVVKDFVFNHPFSSTEPMIVYLDKGSVNHFFVRISNDEKWKENLARIEAAIKKIDSDVPFEFQFVKEEYQKNFAEIQSGSQMASLFGGMAIFISCLGLFGLSAFLAERRSKEISIRKILGASMGSLWYSLSRDFLKPVFIAFIIAAPIAAWSMQKMLSFMDYHIHLSGWMFVLAGVLAFLISIFTISFHAIKAAVANPVDSLRSE